MLASKQDLLGTWPLFAAVKESGLRIRAHLAIALLCFAAAGIAHEPAVVRPGDIESTHFPGHDTLLLSDHSATPSEAAVLEISLPARTFGAPPHIHALEDEHFYVLEGTVEFLDRGSTITAGPGSLVVLPRGHLHGFWNLSDEPAKMLLIVTPGEFASFFDAVAMRVKSENPGSPPEVAAIIAEVASRYEVSIHPEKVPESARVLLP